jgi:hypothetical protein
MTTQSRANFLSIPCMISQIVGVSGVEARQLRTPISHRLTTLQSLEDILVRYRLSRQLPISNKQSQFELQMPITNRVRL